MSGNSNFKKHVFRYYEETRELYDFYSNAIAAYLDQPHTQIDHSDPTVISVLSTLHQAQNKAYQELQMSRNFLTAFY